MHPKYHPRIWLFNDYFKKSKLKTPTLDIGGTKKWTINRRDTYYILNIKRYKNVNIVGIGERLPFKDESIGTVILTEVLEHCQEPEEILKETNRVLENGGELIASVPFSWFYHPSPLDYRRYTKQGLEFLINKMGFDIVGSTTICRLPSYSLYTMHGIIDYMLYSVRNIKFIGKFLRYPFSCLSLLFGYVMVPLHFIAYKLEGFSPSEFIYVTTLIKARKKIFRS